MKILIIDDNEYKINEAAYALKELGITSYDAAACVTDAYVKVRKEKYDLIISDLGLPRHPNAEVENSLVGIEMLTIFAYKNILIPTIVYSTTEIPEEDIDYLKELDFPYLGQARDISSLMDILSSYLNKNDKKAR